MDKRNTGIFELAQLFGISAELLRKYETKGLVTPKRTESKYRKYSTWEINKVFCIRQLSLSGFSLKQAHSFFSSDSFRGRLEETDRLQRQLECEIQERKNRIMLLEDQKEELQAYELRGESMQKGRSCELRCCMIESGELLIEKDQGKGRSNLKEWINALPYVSLWFLNGERGLCSCLAISKEDQMKYGLENLVPDFILPEREGVLCNVPVIGNCDYHSTTQAIRSARERAEKEGFHTNGAYRIKLISYTQDGDQYCCYNKCIFLL